MKELNIKNRKFNTLLEKIRNRESNPFDNFILIIITLSSIIIGLETVPEIYHNYHSLILTVDLIILCLFILEIFFKWFAFYPKPWRYFLDGWNIFDFSIVLVSLLPFIFIGTINTEAIIVLRILRLARVFRVFRFISVLKPLQVLISTLIRSIPSMSYIAFLILILFYIYGVIGVFLFRETDPLHYNSLSLAVLTLFQTITGEGWPDLLAIQGEHGNTLIAAIFYISFIIIGSMIILNLFIGVIISELEKLKEMDARGKDRIDEEGHVLILGWSPKMKYLIEELIFAFEDDKAIITILADKSKFEMDNYFENYIPETKNIHFIFRTGHPFEKKDLKMMNTEYASSIIILDSNEKNQDSYVLKVLLSLTTFFADKPMPNISLPLQFEKNHDIAQLISNNSINAVIIDDIISRLIAQSCRQSGLSVIYNELLSFDGHEIYSKSFPNLTGKSFRDCINQFDESSVIGIRNGEKVKINPDFDYTIKKDDELISITENENSFIQSKKKEINKINTAITSHKNGEKKIENTYIFGYNHRINNVLIELDSYVKKGSCVSVYLSKNIINIDETAIVKLSNQELKIVDIDTTLREELEAIDFAICDNIIIMNYCDSLDIEESDSSALITLLYIRHILTDRSLTKPIVTELYNNKNEEYISSSDLEDMIISDKIDSLLLSQYSQNPFLKYVYEDLLDYEGSEIYIKPASDFISTKKEYKIRDISYHVNQHNQLLIGYQKKVNSIETRLNKGFEINPDKDEEIYIDEDDKLVVIAENDHR